MPARTKRRQGYTRLSSKRQITIPLGILRQTGLEAGDELKVEVEGSRIVLSPSLSMEEQRLAAIEKTAGSMPGVYEPGGLERLRSEWR